MASYPTRFRLPWGLGRSRPGIIMPPQAGGASQKCSPPITSRFPWTEVFASVLARFWVNSWPLVAKNPESNQNRRTRTNLGGDVPRTSYAPPKFADDGRRSTNAIHSHHRGDVPRTSYAPLNLWRMDGHHSPWPSS